MCPRGLSQVISLCTEPNFRREPSLAQILDAFGKKSHRNLRFPICLPVVTILYSRFRYNLNVRS